jgi:hypothetical protein
MQNKQNVSIITQTPQSHLLSTVPRSEWTWIRKRTKFAAV